MAKLSKSDAAKVAGISRQTLYTYLKDGRISVGGDGLIDTAELLRAGFTLHEIGRQNVTPDGQVLTSNVTGEALDVYRELVATLQKELESARQREEAQTAHITQLTSMLQDMQQQHQRLLEAPKLAEASPAPPAVDTQQSRWQRLRQVFRK